MNKANLIGRVTKDIEVKQATNTMVAKFTLAVNRRKKDDGADFISCTAFGKTAEAMGQYVHKGDRVGIVGRIQTGSYEKDGNKFYTTDIIVEELDFLEGKRQDAEATATQGDSDFMTPTNTDDLPF